MSKNYIFTLFLGLSLSLSAFAAKPIIKHAHLSRDKSTSDVVTSPQRVASVSAALLSEDFSKFTAGTEETPDILDISDETTGEIPASYTQTEGWYGWGVQQAGGIAYMGWVNYSDYYDAEDGPGYIATPYFDASGATDGYIIKFRARSKSADGDSLYVYSNYNEADYDEHLVVITNQWAEYTVTAEIADANSYVDIYGTASEFYLDDLNIYDVNSTGVQNLKDKNLNVWVSNNKVTFFAAFGEKAEVFNALGQKLFTQITTEGKNSFEINAKGILIVKVGNRTGKVIL